MKSTNYTRLVALVICLIVLSSTAAFAQTGAGKNYVSTDTIFVVGEREVIPVANTIATKLPVSLRQTPASVGVVTNTLIENQDAVVLGDALRNVSGVNAQTGFGVFDYFIIRGFESLTNGLVLTDGAAEPEITFYNLYNVDRVEVLKGPGAFLYGGNPLSATVNLVRKQPVFKNFLHAAGSYGHFSSYRNTVDLGLADVKSGAAFRLNALWQDSKNYRDDKDNDNLSVNPALTWRLNERTSLTANFEYVKSKYKPDSGLPLLIPDNRIPDVPRTRSYQSPFDISDQTVMRARLDFEKRVSPTLTLRNKFYYTDLDWDSDGTLLFGAFPAGPDNFVVGRSLTALVDRQKLVGNQFEAVFNFDTAILRHQLLAGYEVSRHGDKFTLSVGELPFISLYEPAGPTNHVTPFPVMINDARSLIIAPYFLDRIIFSENFQAVIGGRFDLIDYNDSRQIPSRDRIFSLPTSRDYTKLSPTLGLVYSPVQSFTFYANAGQAFGPPSSQVIGDHEAEESTQFELGAKTGFLNGKLNATLAAYHLEKNNLLIPDFNGTSYLAGEQRSRGFEVDIILQAASNWQTFMAYAFTDAELTKFSEEILVSTPQGQLLQRLDRSGNTPAFAPKHILNVWTNKTLNNRLGIGVGGRYLNAQFIDEDNLFKIDSIFIIDAMLYYQIGNWRWSLNAKNLTDTEYETRAFGSGSVLPGNPFTIYGGVEFRL